MKSTNVPFRRQRSEFEQIVETTIAMNRSVGLTTNPKKVRRIVREQVAAYAAQKGKK